jgi:hypothetical protein
LCLPTPGKAYLTLTPQNRLSNTKNNTKQTLEISLQIHPENFYRKKVAQPLLMTGWVKSVRQDAAHSRRDAGAPQKRRAWEPHALKERSPPANRPSQARHHRQGPMDQVNLIGSWNEMDAKVAGARRRLAVFKLHHSRSAASWC